MDDSKKSKEQLVAELRGLRAELNAARARGNVAFDETTEAQLARAKRLETAGTVAGQIAHDFNNLLTPLMAYPALIRKDLPDGAAGREILDIMEKTAHDMAHITQQLLSLSRRGHVVDEKEFDINAVVKQAVALIKSGAPSGIKIDASLSGEIAPIKGGDDQVLRVLQNICQNAVDAMGDEGTLSIKTENVYLDRPVGHYDTIKNGSYVKVTVTDTGPGIPNEIKDRIFDPFFTTKKATKRRGSGLGLSVVHGIMKDHEGYVDLSSAPGAGTTFCLYFPRPAMPEETRQPEQDMAGGHEKILVVDDDPTQIDVNSKILASLGYEVVGVTSGEEAVEFIKTHAVDLILLDIVMPAGMDGVETYQKIKELKPDQRAIIVSAYDEHEGVAKMQRMGAGEFIRKAVTMEKLARAVRQELDGAVQGGARRDDLRILLVDDEEMIRSLFRMILSTALPEVQIDTAANGAEAVESFKALHPTLLVMDLNMPVMDGREAFKRIQETCSQEGRKMPPVIFCTGFAPPESIKKTVAETNQHVLLSKPVTEEALVEAVKKRL
ncbi:MAG: response regulator [Kiritimatiellae bacterium]|nr:response regulator [Kiritimatiellia bacterium]